MSSRTSSPREQQHVFWNYGWFRNQSFTEKNPFPFHLIKILGDVEAVTIFVKPATYAPKTTFYLNFLFPPFARFKPIKSEMTGEGTLDKIFANDEIKILSRLSVAVLK